MRVLTLVPIFALAIACTAPTEDDVGETSGEALTDSAACSLSRSKILSSVRGERRTAIERGFGWLDARVPYSQSRTRDGYRTDCSGFVSMCWELDESYTTADFTSGQGQNEVLSSYDELLPGDALVRLNSYKHVVLFLGWDEESDGACVLEEKDTANDMQFGVRSRSSLERGGYKPIRANTLASDTNAQDVDDDRTDNGSSGTCDTDAQCPGAELCIFGQCQ